MSDIMLELKNVTMTFFPGTVNARKGLDNVSLQVENGDFITIIGANGAGKSTLFNVVCGDFITDSGSIFLDGENVTVQSSYQRSRNIGRLFQDPMRGTAPGMTIEENLSLACAKGGWLSFVSKAEKNAFRERLADLHMGLEDRMKAPVGTLSGGQRQALSLIMATYNPVKLLLLDEHIAALDPGSAEKVLNLTRDVVEKNHLTCMMITHNMQSALDLGNRTLMMDHSRIALDLKGSKRNGLTVKDLLDLFKQSAGKELNNDRMLLS